MAVIVGHRNFEDDCLCEEMSDEALPASPRKNGIHPLHTSMIWCTKAELKVHVLCIAVLWAIVTAVAASNGVFNSIGHTRQYLGHLLPSFVALLLGITNLCTHKWTSDQNCLFEAVVLCLLGAVWLLAIIGVKIFNSDYNDTPFLTYMLSMKFEGMHSSAFFFVGLCGVIMLVSRRKEPYQRLKHWTWIYVGFIILLLIYAHDQPNDLGLYMHWNFCFWVVLGGIIRGFLGEKGHKEFGMCYFMAAAMLFGGQDGLTMSLTEGDHHGSHHGSDQGSHHASHSKHSAMGYVIAWNASAITVILVYMSLF